MSGFEDMDDDTLKSYLEIRDIQEKIIELRKKGKSYECIAQEVGWSLETITVFLTTNQYSPDYQGKLPRLS